MTRPAKRIVSYLGSGPGFAAAFVGLLVGLAAFTAHPAGMSILFGVLTYAVMLVVLSLA